MVTVHSEKHKEIYVIKILHDDPELIEKIDRVCVDMIAGGEMECARKVAKEYNIHFGGILARNSKKITFEMLKRNGIN